jgi:hypothetical protein
MGYVLRESRPGGSASRFLVRCAGTVEAYHPGRDLIVRGHPDADKDLFQPLRPAKGVKLLLAAVIGPVAWIVAWLIAAWLIYRTDAIELGLLITLGSFLVAVPTLALLTWGRNREERRFERDRR